MVVLFDISEGHLGLWLFVIR